jgi:hypothetical protein
LGRGGRCRTVAGAENGLCHSGDGGRPFDGRGRLVDYFTIG